MSAAGPLPPGCRRIFIRDLVLPARIGVWTHEQERPQRVRLNLDLTVEEAGSADRLEDVVRYDVIADGVRGLVAAGHINLVETLAERLAALCLAEPRVRTVRVRVEKLDVYADAASVGVEIERMRA